MTDWLALISRDLHSSQGVRVRIMSCFSSSYFISLSEPLLLFHKAPGRGGGLNVLVCLVLL